MKTNSPAAKSYDYDNAISVVIPTFNRADLLAKAISSVQRQSYTNWKLFIADNASTDHTSLVAADAARGDTRISYHRHVENLGMLANWEFAISKVGTQYFCILSDDDLVLPEFFQAAMWEMLSHPEIGLCFGVTAAVDEKGHSIGRAPTAMAPGYYSAGLGAPAMLKAQHPASTATLFRSQCVISAGGFDSQSHYLADLDMMLRVALRYPIIFFGEEVAFHVAHANNAFRDDLCWYPGLRVLIANVNRLEDTDQAPRNATLANISSNVLAPLLANMVIRLRGHPVTVLKSTEFRFALDCLRETRHVGAAMMRLPILVFRRFASLLKRVIIRGLFPISENRATTQRHPRADDYFPAE